MIDIITKFKHKLNLVAIQVGIEPVYEMIHFEGDTPHYEVFVLLGDKAFTARFAHESEAQAKFDNLLDECVLYLYSVKIDILDKVVNSDKIHVYYTFSYEAETNARMWHILVEKQRFIEFLKGEYRSGYACSDDDEWENIEDGDLRDFIKHTLTNNYLNNIDNL